MNVADRENSRIQVFLGNGRFVREWRGVHRSDHIQQGKDGRFYVAELRWPQGLSPTQPTPNAVSQRSGVKIMTAEGGPLGGWGMSTDTPGDVIAGPAPAIPRAASTLAKLWMGPAYKNTSASVSFQLSRQALVGCQGLGEQSHIERLRLYLGLSRRAYVGGQGLWGTMPVKRPRNNLKTVVPGESRGGVTPLAVGLGDVPPVQATHRAGGWVSGISILR